jgi:hypothetical protein
MVMSGSLAAFWKHDAIERDPDDDFTAYKVLNGICRAV